jgi:hypothetical protein
VTIMDTLTRRRRPAAAAMQLAEMPAAAVATPAPPAAAPMTEREKIVLGIVAAAEGAQVDCTAEHAEAFMKCLESYRDRMGNCEGYAHVLQADIDAFHDLMRVVMRPRTIGRPGSLHARINAELLGAHSPLRFCHSARGRGPARFCTVELRLSRASRHAEQHH